MLILGSGIGLRRGVEQVPKLLVSEVQGDSGGLGYGLRGISSLVFKIKGTVASLGIFGGLGVD